MATRTMWVKIYISSSLHILVQTYQLIIYYFSICVQYLEKKKNTAELSFPAYEQTKI